MTLRFPWDGPPQASAGAVELQSVVPGLRWVCMPLPFVLNHVNVWLLDDGSNTFIVDTSLQTQSTVALWQKILVELDSPLSGLLITHYHPDHVGMAGWFSANYSVPVWFSRREYKVANEAWQARDADFAANQDSWYIRHGLDEARRADMFRAGNSYRPLVHALPDNPGFVADGDLITIGGYDWLVMTVGGHAPEMICLYSQSHNVLIAADHILPSISPNISLSFYTADPDPLGTFLVGLDRFLDLPEDVLVLPSHGLPFYGLQSRIEALKSHHQQRFDTLASHCVEPQTATAMLPVLFRRDLDSQQLMFAMGESIAHLNHLATIGQFERRLMNGVEHFIVH